MSKPLSSKVTVTSRRLRNLNVIINKFNDDIKKSQLILNPFKNVDDLVSQYNRVLNQLLDQHVPTTTRILTVRPHTPWYSTALHLVKRKKRILERRWIKSRLEGDRQVFRDCCNHYYSLLEKAKVDHFTKKLGDCDSRELFRMVKKLSYETIRLLPSGSHQDIANNFLKFFTEKITCICDKLSTSDVRKLSFEISESCDSCLSSLTPLSNKEVLDIIKSLSSRSCQLDPIPTSLLKDSFDLFLPTITDIVNSSLTSGWVPSSLKCAVITPILKEDKLDPDILGNYRPVSNLPFLSKVIERAVMSQLQTYLDANNLENNIQSAYRRFHSTETALTCVQNDILRAIDDNLEVVLVLLDLSAAFDTINHNIFLNRLKNLYGIEGLALKWMESYLSERFQCVAVDIVTSDYYPLKYGVPQGSIIGPKGFVLYTEPISLILKTHGIEGMMYADDTQLYVCFDSLTKADTLKSLENCIADVRSWLMANKLMFNGAKTEIIHFTSRFRRADLLSPLKIESSYLCGVPLLRNLGIFYDNHLSMKAHVNRMCRTSNFQLWIIGQLRKFLDRPTTERLIHAFISSRLDYCNSLLYGLPETEISKLQRVQNSAARLLVGAGKYDNVNGILRTLHWLPVRKRILFKILLWCINP